VKNGQSETYFDPNIAGGAFVNKNNVLVDVVSGSNIELESGKIIKSISFNDETEKYELTASYDMNDVLLLAKKGATQKVVLHVLNADTTIQKVEIAVTDSMFIEII
jgi:hypothetical protein